MADPVNLSGLALRAGKTVRGDSLLPSIRDGRVCLVVACTVMGANRKKKIMDKCRTYGVPVTELTPEQFDRIGPKAGQAFGITDAGFAKAIQKATGTDM